jgi:hypothetical protein
MKKKDGDDLSPRVRAEDILLGSLGFGEDARVIAIERTDSGYKGIGEWPDGEQFEFENEDELEELDEWALSVLLADTSLSPKRAVGEG